MDRSRTHLERTFGIFGAKTPDLTWEAYLANLYPLDWFLCCGCLESDNRTGKSYSPLEPDAATAC